MIILYSITYHCMLFCVDFFVIFFFFSSRRRHTRWNCDWSSDVCSSDLLAAEADVHVGAAAPAAAVVVAVVVQAVALPRSEERRVGKECRSRWAPDDEKKKKIPDESRTSGRTYVDRNGVRQICKQRLCKA